jgi:4-oxalocrotonate tautomerase
MPMVNITMGPCVKEIKEKIISNVTKTIAEITGIPDDKFMIAISELPHENLGLGRQTIAQIKESIKE